MLQYIDGIPYTAKKVHQERLNEISFQIQDLKDEIASLQNEAKELTEKQISKMLNLIHGDFLYAWYRDSQVLCEVSSFSWNAGLDSPEIIVHLYSRGTKKGPKVTIFPEDVTARFNNSTSAKTARQIINTFHL